MTKIQNPNAQNAQQHKILNFCHLNFEFVSACPGATCLDDCAAHVSRVWARDFDIRVSDLFTPSPTRKIYYSDRPTWSVP